MAKRPLTLVVCGAPLAARASEVLDVLQAEWSVSLVVTDAAGGWFARQSDADRPRPEAVVVCPLTFNTANKVAAGIMDNSAAGALCDALAAAVPFVAVPMLNDRLWRHPVWESTLATFANAGARLVDVRTGRVGRPEPVPSGTGPEVVAAFEPHWVVSAVR